jgi:heat-inducible transcriptional repressor
MADPNLEQRKQAILKAVVHEFTASAVPVGSQSLVRSHFVNLSSATVRSELQELSELGFLAQPHTSAGRIPTDLGYRYFVDFLMEKEAVPPAVHSYIEEEIRSAPGEAHALTERVAMTVAAVTDVASVATASAGPLARLKHVDLIALDGAEALLILLVEGNLLRQQVLRLEPPFDQAQLSKVAATVNRDLAGRDRQAVSARAGGLAPGLERELLERLAESLAAFERGTGGLVVHDGVRNLLRQPEFAEPTRLREVLEVLEETQYLAALLQELIADSDLEIVIGSEHATSQLRSCTVVLTTYGPASQVKGVLGAVGPTRMRYSQIVARLRAVAQAAGERLAEPSA